MPKIPDLPFAGALTGAETIPLVQDGVTKQASLADFLYAAIAAQNRRAAQALINDWMANPSAKALAHAEAISSGLAARTAAARILARIRARAGDARVTVYADPSAAGGNDGSSWDDAFTDLDVAIAAVPEGGLLLTNSTEANPFPAPANAIAAASNFVEWCRDMGPDGETWISGAQRAGDWEDLGGGLYRRAQAVEPVACAFNYRRDTKAGAVTGIDLTQRDIAMALQAQFVDRIWSVDDCVAWYGAQAKEPIATPTPALDKWSWHDGYHYVRPSEAASLADVEDKLIWADQRACVQVTAVVHDWYIWGRGTGFFTPQSGEGSGGGGYTTRFQAGTRIVFQGTRGIMSGYHTEGCTGNSGRGNIILDHLTVGHRHQGIPIVFYTAAGDLLNAGHHSDRTTAISFGLLGPTGMPLEANFAAKLAYSHTGNSFKMTGITHSRSVLIDCTGQITAKSGVANNVRGINPQWAAATGETADLTRPDGMGIAFHGLVILGRQALPPGRARVVGFDIRGLGFGDGTGDQFSLNTAGAEGTSAWIFNLRDGLWIPPLVNRVLTAATANDFIRFDGVVLRNLANYLVNTTADNDMAIQMVRSLLAGNTYVQANPTAYAELDKNFESYGGNFLQGVKAAEHTTPAAGSITPAQLLAQIDPNGRDVVVDNLTWALM